MLVKPYTKRYNSPILEILTYFYHPIYFIVLCLYLYDISIIMKDTHSYFLLFALFILFILSSMICSLLFVLVSWYPGILISQYLLSFVLFISNRLQHSSIYLSIIIIIMKKQYSHYSLFSLHSILHIPHILHISYLINNKIVSFIFPLCHSPFLTIQDYNSPNTIYGVYIPLYPHIQGLINPNYEKC